MLRRKTRSVLQPVQYFPDSPMASRDHVSFLIIYITPTDSFILMTVLRGADGGAK